MSFLLQSGGLSSWNPRPAAFPGFRSTVRPRAAPTQPPRSSIQARSRPGGAAAIVVRPRLRTRDTSARGCRLRVPTTARGSIPCGAARPRQPILSCLPGFLRPGRAEAAGGPAERVRQRPPSRDASRVTSDLAGPPSSPAASLPDPAELAEPPRGRRGTRRPVSVQRLAAAALPRPERAGRPPLAAPPRRGDRGSVREARLGLAPGLRREERGGAGGGAASACVTGGARAASGWKECKMTNEEPLPKKVRLSETDFKVMARDELILRWKQYEAYVQALEGKYTDLNSNDVTGLRESEEKLKQQQQESARRENILVMRLATKEQEMQECTTQIQYLKQVQQPSVAQLRSTMVDPAINLFFLKMKGELEQTKDKLEQAQNELSAWKFTPDSQTGKKLMAKCRMLIQENQELGRQLSQGRIAQLEAELALQKKYSEELKSSQDELNDFIIQLDEEVEGMQSTILVLQQQLKETRQQLAQYQQQQSQASAPSTSRTTSSEPVDQAEATSKDCSRLANGPSNGSSSRQRTSGSGFHREGNTTEDDFPSSSGNGNKASNSSEERTGRGGSSYINPLSAGYESVDSPTGSENSLTHHSNDTDSSHDPQEEKAVSGKGNRTVGSRHIQNGLDSSVNVQGSVL